MSTLKPHTDEAETMFLTGLKEIAPSAVLFSSLVPLEQARTSTPQVVRKLPLLLTSLQKQIYLVMSEELKAACEDVFTNKIVVTQEEAKLP